MVDRRASCYHYKIVGKFALEATLTLSVVLLPHCAILPPSTEGHISQLIAMYALYAKALRIASGKVKNLLVYYIFVAKCIT